MTTLKSLPVRPSFESIRKQAKRLARDVADGNAAALARTRAQLPDAELPLSQRDAQLVLAREYGFAGWQDLREEALKRIGSGLEWASVQAERAIHDDDIERLQQLLAEYPALLSWSGESGGLLAHAVGSFGDSFAPFREERFTRRACAELLIDAGALVTALMWEGLINARARGMLQLLWSKGLLPRVLKILTALGDLAAVRACFDESNALRAGTGNSNAFVTVNDAFICACRFEHEAVASFLLDGCIALDPDLGKRIDTWQGRSAFIKYLGEHPERFGNPATDAASITPWRVFLMHEALRVIDEDDLPAFVSLLRSESWLRGEIFMSFQVQLFERATLKDRGAFITELLDLDLAMLRRRPPPESSALKFAFEYGKAHLVPLLRRIWPLPDDLPHAAGLGDFTRVKHWFDATGLPALGNPRDHYPGNNAHMTPQQGSPVQQILDTALAWACLNRHLEIAAFLLEHGADINTTWSTHEPASILHELVFHDNYPAMQFLIDRGIDMTTRDYRWNATAEGWAYHAAKDEKMAAFLAAAEQQREKRKV